MILRKICPCLYIYFGQLDFIGTTYIWSWKLGICWAPVASHLASQQHVSNACWIRVMMKSSKGNIFRVTGHFCGKFTGDTKASDAELYIFFDLHPNKLLSKQSWGWWFKTPLRPLWRHRNGCLAPAPHRSLLARFAAYDIGIHTESCTSNSEVRISRTLNIGIDFANIASPLSYDVNVRLACTFAFVQFGRICWGFEWKRMFDKSMSCI